MTAQQLDQLICALGLAVWLLISLTAAWDAWLDRDRVTLVICVVLTVALLALAAGLAVWVIGGGSV